MSPRGLKRMYKKQWLWTNFNFEQISHLVLVLFFLTLNMQMFTFLNFNLFSNVSLRKKTNQRWIYDPHIIYDGALCDSIMSGSHYVLTEQLQLRWYWNQRPAFVCYCLQFPCWNWKHGGGQTSRGLKHFIFWYFFSFLKARNIIYCFLCWQTVVLGEIHLYADVCTKFYLNKYFYFGNIRINCTNTQRSVISKHQIFSATNFD